MEAALRDLPPLTREFPVPAGAGERLLMLLDIAQVTTDAHGARATPARVLRELVEAAGPADPAVRALVALVTRLGEDPAGRALVEMAAPRAAA
jgi:hypothetical protein